MHISVFIARFWISNYPGMLCRILGWVKGDKKRRGHASSIQTISLNCLCAMCLCAAPRGKNPQWDRRMRLTFLRMSIEQAHVGKKHVYFLVQMQDRIQNAQCNKYRFSGMIQLFLFILIFYITFIHPITFIQYIHPSSFSGKNLLWVLSRESNSGLAYSKPTNYQLRHAAPLEPRRTLWATPHPLSHTACTIMQ